jgi:radical SAM superfamily enzyme YgiQ (UPF0313 family)
MKKKKNILIISAHFHCERVNRKAKDFLQPMIGLHIASQIDSSKYDVFIYNELSSGAYNTDRKKFYDIVFLSGIQKDFDRMRQLSYFFRKKGSIVIAGGSICTLYPDFAQNFFDVVCKGGVESVSKIMTDFENSRLMNFYHTPQHEINEARLDHSILKKCGISTSTHLIEASRGCNYTCGFCTIPAEKARHSPYSIERMTDDIKNSLKCAPLFSFKKIYPTLYFIDNHFTLNRKSTMELCSYLKSEKKVKWWGALISQNDLADRRLISMMKSCKCGAIFTGLESIDEIFLAAAGKKQNLSNSSTVIDDIDRTQAGGIIVDFGYLFDPRISSIKEMKEQFVKIARSEILLFPCFFSFVSPLLGTRVFNESIRRRELIPGLRLRDLDGSTIAYSNPKDSFEDLSEFAAALYRDMGQLFSRLSMLKKTAKYIWRYRITHPVMWYIVYQNNLRPYKMFKYDRKYPLRSHIGGSDVLDPQYQNFPRDITEEDFERYFKPVMVTDGNGNAAEWLKKYIQDEDEHAENKIKAPSLI